MNDIQIIKNEKEIIGKQGDTFVHFKLENGFWEMYFGNKTEILKVDRFELLAFAEQAKDKNLQEASLKIASILFHPRGDRAFNALYGTVALSIARRGIKHEFYYQQLFKVKSERLGYGKVIERKSNRGGIPDAWVTKDGKDIPVEVKIDEFNQKALKQLLNYMDIYQTESGIAVARRLTVQLPDNIKFVPFSELEG